MEFYYMGSREKRWSMFYGAGAFIQPTMYNTKFDSVTWSVRPVAATTGLSLAPQLNFRKGSIRAGGFAHLNITIGNNAHTLGFGPPPVINRVLLGTQLSGLLFAPVGRSFCAGIEARYRFCVTDVLNRFGDDDTAVTHVIDKMRYHSFAILFHLNN